MRLWKLLVLAVAINVAHAESLTLPVLLLDRSNVPPTVLAKAKDHYSSVLEQAGVTVEWVPADPSATGDVDPSLVVIHLLSGERAKRVSRSVHLLGMALVKSPGQPVDAVVVFYERIRALAWNGKSSLPLLMSHVMAHETGHLLLGAGHAVDGVMKARVAGKDMLDIGQGQGAFLPGEIARLRGKLRRRMARSEQTAAAVRSRQDEIDSPEPAAALTFRSPE